MYELSKCTFLAFPRDSPTRCDRADRGHEEVDRVVPRSTRRSGTREKRDVREDGETRDRETPGTARILGISRTPSTVQDGLGADDDGEPPSDSDRASLLR